MFNHRQFKGIFLFNMKYQSLILKIKKLINISNLFINFGISNNAKHLQITIKIEFYSRLLKKKL